MLWSDPRDEPAEEVRQAQAKLRRLAWLMPAAVLLGVLLVMWH